MSLLFLVLMLLAKAPHTDEGPSEAELWDHATTLDREGAHEEAARVFAPLADAYPQDFAIQLQAAWLLFQAEDYARAETHYARAVALSEGDPLARSGLAWTHLRQGRSRKARLEFEALLADRPGFGSAEAGLAELRRRSFSAQPYAHGVGHVYGAHPDLHWAAGVSVGAPMVIAEHVLWRPAYRYTHFMPRDTGQQQGAMMGQGGGLDPFAQHEAHVGLGLTWPQAGVLGQYAYLHDGSAAANHAHVVGLSVRYSPWGDGYVDGSAAAFASGWVGRVAPAWRMPATAWLDLRPGFALQFVAREVLPSGFASLVFHGRPGAIVLGGKGGPEERPVYLETPAIFAFAGRIFWGAWLAGRLALGRGFHLHASYETHHLRAATSAGATTPTQIHYVALGLSWSSVEALAL